MSNAMDVIGEAVRKASEEIAQAQERYVREICEALRITPEELAEGYVFETGPVVAVRSDSVFSDPVEFRLRQEYRLRRKTEDERAADSGQPASEEIGHG